MRDCRIDILRFVGLAMIIFAHVDPPGILFQLRNFDVPLMVLVSGMSFGLSYSISESYMSYIWKRIKRLVFPVWIFLTLYFSAQFVFYPESADLNFKTMFTSYAFISGIGYVWIIKVFILVALVSPFVFSYNKNALSSSKYFFVLFGLLIIYELLRYLTLPHIESGIGKLISLVTHYIIPYAIVFAIGLRLPSLSKKQLLLLAFSSLLCLIVIGFWLTITLGKFIPTQELKYPPSIYYIAYALFASVLLWTYCDKIERAIEVIKIKKVVLFIAQNSIWIYLWHIPFVKFIQVNFAIKYILVFSLAATITYLQVFYVAKLNEKYINNHNIRKNIKVLFTG